MLSNDVTWLHTKWAQYRELFGVSEARIDLLNRTAGHFFRVLQDTLFEDVLLHLSRLTDGAVTGRKENLSLERLVLLAPDEIKLRLEALLGAVRAACAPARDWRNRRIAHKDLGVALATAGDPLPGISRQTVEEALSAVRDLLHHIERQYFAGAETYYQELLAIGQAKELLFWLSEGVQAEEERRRRFREGRALPEDCHPRKEV
jgi:hypothetical protein